jgi:hypothetical protein
MNISSFILPPVGNYCPQTIISNRREYIPAPHGKLNMSNMSYVPGILYVRTAGDLVTSLGIALLLRHAIIVIFPGKISSTLII